LDTASIQFVLFGLSAALISNINRSRTWRSIILFLASVIFLGLLARGLTAIVPLGGFLLLGYAGMLVVERRGSKSLAACLIAVILVYAWLKKYPVLPEAAFLHSPYITVGLSYIFFRVLHLIIDTAESDDRRHIGPGAYLLYTLNFTTLVSGPIQRYEDFSRDQFADQAIELDAGVVGVQLSRIVVGFFKVNVLAMLLQTMQENALAELSQPLALTLKMYAAFRLAVIYPFFLYANFSGYIDIVIAVARLMRLRLPENFNRPFSASSFLDFWNRWHITLSSWLKTYVYNPLLVALMRRISSRPLQPFLGVFCFFVTFFLIGIWHGRTSEFVAFGVLQGGGISLNKLWQLALTSLLSTKGYRALARNSLYIAFGRGLTFTWFAFTLFWFWAAWNQIHRIFTAMDFVSWATVWLAIWLCATGALAAWEWLRAGLLSIQIGNEPVLTSRYARVVYASALGLAAFVVSVLLNETAPDIIYKAF
jgi:D-alanyl-lipoteichoic acid acyltransferase DltB (MBOAT superfamily)